VPVLELASTLSNISNPFQLPSVLVSNANHLLNKVDDLYSIVTSHEVDVVCITVSWLDSSTPNTLCTIGNYEIYRKDRPCGLGDGVMLCVECNSGVGIKTAHRRTSPHSTAQHRTAPHITCIKNAHRRTEPKLNLLQLNGYLTDVCNLRDAGLQEKQRSG
jgi:hypothetical protein